MRTSNEYTVSVWGRIAVQEANSQAERLGVGGWEFV
jgi:hypothetical protein